MPVSKVRVTYNDVLKYAKQQCDLIEGLDALEAYDVLMDALRQESDDYVRRLRLDTSRVPTEALYVRLQEIIDACRAKRRAEARAEAHMLAKTGLGTLEERRAAAAAERQAANKRLFSKM